MTTPRSTPFSTPMLSKALSFLIVVLAIYGSFDLIYRGVFQSAAKEVTIDRVQVNADCVGFQFLKQGNYRYVMACQDQSPVNFSNGHSDVKVHNCGSLPCVPPTKPKKEMKPMA